MKRTPRTASTTHACLWQIAFSRTRRSWLLYHNGILTTIHRGEADAGGGLEGSYGAFSRTARRNEARLRLISTF